MRLKKIKTNKKIKNKTNRYLFLLITVMLLSLSVGHSAINSDVTILGEANFRVLEELRITDISLYETTYNGEEPYSPKFTKDTLTLGVDLKEVESSITYKIELINYGTVAQKVSNIGLISNSNENATYELVGYNANTLIYPGETQEIYITIKYKSNVSVLPEITTVDLVLGTEYITPESTLTASNTDGSTGTFFNSGPIQKGQVESVEFLPTLEVGENALGFWDASYELNGTVIAWYTDEDEDNLYELYLGGNGKVYAYSDSNLLFYKFDKVTSINFGEYFDTSNVVYMGDPTNMEKGMFSGCSSLTILDLSSFDTSNVRHMAYMFMRCPSLASITLGENFNTSKVTNLNQMFEDCKLLTSLNLSVFVLRNGVNLSYMFRNCSRLTYLDIRNCEFVSVTTTYAFSYLPASCNIIVKSDTERDFILGIRSTFTNIQTVAELESL